MPNYFNTIVPLGGGLAISFGRANAKDSSSDETNSRIDTNLSTVLSATITSARAGDK
jgi:hypothetical protein